MQPDRRLIPLADVKPEPVSWFWPNRIPRGALTILEGDPGQAKSSLTYDLAARCTRGWAMPNCQGATEPAGVVLLQAEDGLGNTVRPNLQAAGADINRVYVYDRCRFQNDPLNLPADLSILASAVASVRARLVVIDPVNAFLAANVSNEQSVRRALASLSAFAEQTGAAILLVRHLTKSSGPKSHLYRGIGSIAFVAASRSALLATADPCTDDPHQHVLVQTKSNLSDAVALAYRTVKKGSEIVVEWLGKANYTPQQVAGVGQNAISALMEASYVLYSILAEGPVWASEVITLAARATVSKRTLLRAKALLRVQSKKRGSGTGSRWMWELPQNDSTLRAFKDRDIAELTDRLIHGDEDDPPLPGDEWKQQPGDNLDRDSENDDGDGQVTP